MNGFRQLRVGNFVILGAVISIALMAGCSSSGGYTTTQAKMSGSDRNHPSSGIFTGEDGKGVVYSSDRSKAEAEAKEAAAEANKAEAAAAGAAAGAAAAAASSSTPAAPKSEEQAEFEKWKAEQDQAQYEAWKKAQEEQAAGQSVPDTAR
jgi:hypothetical protein